MYHSSPVNPNPESSNDRIRMSSEIQPSSASPPPKRARKDVDAPKKLTRSCAECRRRRIRCDSTDAPCGQCRWYKVQDVCHYPVRQRRNVPSKESFSVISSSLHTSERILEELFPSMSVESLASLTREELVALILSPKTTNLEKATGGVVDDTLQCLESSPQQDYQWDESTQSQNPGSKVFDDVNGLSLAIDRSSSYLGISSINAVLRVIAHISPDFRAWVRQKPGHIDGHDEPLEESETTLPDERLLIDAYFANIHCVTPMISEPDFRERHARGSDQGPPWLALLNMVLAMGSLTTSHPDEKSHTTFYSRAYQHLSLDSFGTGHLETVQALGLLGGYYCHHLNRPNMANVIMGAALRMAVAMGLHREHPAKLDDNHKQQNNSIHETRRRVWWSLFCLDTWASLTLGRPSLGRWEPATITVELPTSGPKPDIAGMSLLASVEFCKIGTSIQDRFARLPLISCQEILDFDKKLAQWSANLPAILDDSESCPPVLRVARGLMHARHQNLRLVLYRPRLLISTLSKSSQADPKSEEEIIVERCRSIASQIVSHTAQELFPVQVWVRTLVWFLFQACMVPLLGLFSDPKHEKALKWREDIENAIIFLDDMFNWGPTVRRTREVVSNIYEASKRSGTPEFNSEMYLGQASMWDPSGMDVFWGGGDWESLPGFNDFSFDTTDFGEMNYLEFGVGI